MAARTLLKYLASTFRRRDPNEKPRFSSRAADSLLQDVDLTRLRILPVTEKNKRSLFGDAIKASQDRQPESEAVLARLKQFHPATAKDFDIKHLAQSEAPFRLLGDLIESDPYSSPLKFNIFIVLSYC